MMDINLKIVPCTLREANNFVSTHHRHNGNVRGCKFALAIKKDDEICGVAICGRPASRHYDDGKTLEINRVCTNGVKNGCSKLYGACCRVAKEMGYERVITYTLITENGASLKASNFICEGEAGGIEWTGKQNPANKEIQMSMFPQMEKPHVMKMRWVRVLNKRR